MRIDSATGTKAWLVGKFSGSFKGHLTGSADSASFAETASYALIADSASYAAMTYKAATASVALTASYVNVEDVDGLDHKMQGEYLPISGGVISGSLSVIDRLRAEGKLEVGKALEVKETIHASGSIATEGQLRIKGAVLKYDDLHDALQFLFVSQMVSPTSDPFFDDAVLVPSTGSSSPTSSYGSGNSSITNNFQH